MKFNNAGFYSKSALAHWRTIGWMVVFSITSINPAIAATIGFSGNVVAPTHRALMPESNEIVTFTNRVGIRFRSENSAAEPIKMNLSVRDSTGNKVRPVSIVGKAVVQPKQQNVITLVLPMAKRDNEVFELCLQHVNKARNILNKTCSKLSVARLN